MGRGGDTSNGGQQEVCLVILLNDPLAISGGPPGFHKNVVEKGCSKVVTMSPSGPSYVLHLAFHTFIHKLCIWCYR